MKSLGIVNLFVLLLVNVIDFNEANIPIILNTWKFTAATSAAWDGLTNHNLGAVDSIILGCSTCESLQCDHTVGYGGSPDENGETTLDALIFDGKTMNMGAVAGLRRVKDAAKVAKLVLEHTKHSLLVGDLATKFAENFDFPIESLTTNYSIESYEKWKNANCQPNFWTDVQPDPTESCGPYSRPETNNIPEWEDNSGVHDTIGMIAIDSNGDIAAGTSSNGASHKIPGRVGDAAIIGAGAYAENGIGAAVATGDGDVMMRFLPTFLAVELMRQGKSASEAAKVAIHRIAQKYPDFMGAVLAANDKGEYGAACNGIEQFPFSIASYQGKVRVEFVKCSTT